MSLEELLQLDELKDDARIKASIEGKHAKHQGSPVPTKDVDFVQFSHYFLEMWPGGFGLALFEDADFEATMEAFFDVAQEFMHEKHQAPSDTR